MRATLFTQKPVVAEAGLTEGRVCFISRLLAVAALSVCCSGGDVHMRMHGRTHARTHTKCCVCQAVWLCLASLSLSPFSSSLFNPTAQAANRIAHNVNVNGLRKMETLEKNLTGLDTLMRYQYVEGCCTKINWFTRTGSHEQFPSSENGEQRRRPFLTAS